MRGELRLQPSGRRGAGAEIVFEVPALEEAYRRAAAAGAAEVEPVRDRPWGQPDFRLTDPDGYYWHIADGSGKPV